MTLSVQNTKGNPNTLTQINTSKFDYVFGLKQGCQGFNDRKEDSKNDIPFKVLCESSLDQRKNASHLLIIM